jgi:predicted 2-oxoglutarate/Fe(II)-dependent dioxygenase YbiX
MTDLMSLLEEVKSSGTFSVGGTLPPIPPGLKVKGLGHVALPLLENQAKALIELSQQAPFGRGEETIVDTDVRNAWQISSEDFELTNPQWEEALQESINQIGKELGLYGCKIEFEQYKLLVYEQGSFFTAHRDTEKMPNMFATLVIGLPSEHAGGELIVSHGEQSYSYSFADGDAFRPSFVAFYPDCYHEVKPITSGYRICLIYNLAIANGERQPLLSQQTRVMEDIGSAIREWSRKKSDDPILTYLLEHSYSEQNLSLVNLKQGDFAKASVLLNAAEANDCRAYLCLVTYYRTSYGEAVYYGRHAYPDDLDEDDFEEYDVDEEEVYAHSFMTSSGDKADIQKLALDEDALLAQTPLRKGPGRGFYISEATGNEGATKDLWYHRGAVILWPKAREFELVARMDVDYCLDFLKRALQEKDGADGERRQAIIQLADHLLERLPFYRNKDISAQLLQIGDVTLLKKYLRKQMAQPNLFGIDNQVLTQVIGRIGWQHFEEVASPYLKSRRGALPWLNALMQVEEPFGSEGHSVMTRWVNDLWQPSLKYDVTRDGIANLIQIVALLGIQALPDKIIAFLAQQTQEAFLTTAYGPALVSSLNELKGRDYDRSCMQKFVEDVVQRIQTDFPSRPRAPKGWSREGQLACDCEFCTEVNRFLPDPERSEITFDKTLKRNLLHIESEIQKSRVDLDIEIHRTPPKFRGICRKNQNRYDRQRQLFDSAQEIMQELPVGNDSG